MKHTLAAAITVGLITLMMVSASNLYADSLSLQTSIEAFKAGLKSGDKDVVASFLDENVLIFEHGHVERSKQEYLGGHFNSDAAFLGATSTEIVKISTTENGELGRHFAETRTRGEFRGSQVDSAGTETLLLKKSDTGWKIYHIHWSSHSIKSKH